LCCRKCNGTLFSGSFLSPHGLQGSPAPALSFHATTPPQALNFGHSVVVPGFQLFNTILALMLKATFFQ
jgi:hypothetical protein